MLALFSSLAVEGAVKTLCAARVIEVEVEEEGIAAHGVSAVLEAAGAAGAWGAELVEEEVEDEEAAAEIGCVDIKFSFYAEEDNKALLNGEDEFFFGAFPAVAHNRPLVPWHTLFDCVQYSPPDGLQKEMVRLDLNRFGDRF